MLERTLDQNDLRGRPNQIYNMDETGLPHDPKSPRIVAERGSGAVTIGSGNKSQVTVVACVSAAGFSIPQMVIWDRKVLGVSPLSDNASRAGHHEVPVYFPFQKCLAQEHVSSQHHRRI